MYNDVGFLVGNRLIALVEAQSSRPENIVVRFLLYLGETYHRYIDMLIIIKTVNGIFTWIGLN